MYSFSCVNLSHRCLSFLNLYLELVEFLNYIKSVALGAESLFVGLLGFVLS